MAQPLEGRPVMDRSNRGTREAFSARIASAPPAAGRRRKILLHIARAALLVVVGFAPLAASAISLGDLEVRSYLGRALDARIALGGADVAGLEDDCFAIVPPSRSGIPAIERGTLKLERAGDATVLRVRTASALDEPALMLGIRASCPGHPGMVLREYPVLLDPAPVAVALPLAASIAPRASSSTANDSRAQAPTAAHRPAKAAHRKHAASRKHASGGAPAHHRSHGHGFMLKLSGPRVDLAASRSMDDASRAKLREELAVLDSDDAMATMLAMRDRMRRLESQVAELQLRVSRMTEAPAQSSVARQPATQPPMAQPMAPAAIPKVVAPAAPQPVVADSPNAHRWPWIVLALVVILFAGALAWTLRRRRSEAQAAWDFEPAPRPMPAMAPEAAPEPFEVESRGVPRPLEPILAQPLERSHEALVEAIAPAEEALDVDAVLREARDHYEEGALLHAVQLLQRAIQRDPREERPWLALLELLRREGLVLDHAELAVRFHQVHGGGESWRRVQFHGRELDPANPLYRDERGEPLALDPSTESWLELPPSFDDALEAELRRSLAADAALHGPKPEPSHVIG
jgi:hypothetical protein